MGGEEIPITEDGLTRFLREANSGKKIVVTEYGIVNVSSVDSIVRHKEKMREVVELIRIGRNKKDAVSEVMGPSPFAKLLSDKMPLLSPKSRTEAQEEAAREIRKLQ